MVHMIERPTGLSKGEALQNVGDDTKRDFLRKGFAGAATIMLGITAGKEYIDRRPLRLERDLRTKQRKEALQKSVEFKIKVDAASKQLITQGRLASSLSPNHGRRKTQGDSERRSRIDFVGDMVMHGVSDAELPKVIRDELADLNSGLPLVESMYNNNAIGAAGEETLSQILPDTYKEFGFNKETIKLLKNQVTVIRKMAIQAYAHMQKEIPQELKKIQADYFGESKEAEEAFQRQFLTLAIINSRQAGPGNMTNVIRNFSKEPPPEGVSGYDVFTLMTDLASGGEFDRNYKGLSSEYGFLVFAGADLLSEQDTSAV
jgi:hypothetical protein